MTCITERFYGMIDFDLWWWGGVILIMACVQFPFINCVAFFMLHASRNGAEGLLSRLFEVFQS
jgi:hypothetical protein